MNNNRYKKKNNHSIFSIIEIFLSKTSLSDSLPIKYLSNIIFVFILGLVYVANTHYHQKILRKTASLEKEISELRVSYTTLKSNLIFSIKQTEIAKKVVELDLYESKVPPYLVN